MIDGIKFSSLVKVKEILQCQKVRATDVEFLQVTHLFSTCIFFKNFYNCHNLQCTKYLQFTMFTILLHAKRILLLWTIFTNVESSKSLAVINWLALCYYRNTPNEERHSRALISACFLLNLTSSNLCAYVKKFISR